MTTTCRRLFQGTVIAAGLALCAGAHAAAPASGIEIGFSAYTFRHLTAFEAIEKTRECGGDVIEFFLWQKLSPENPKVILNADLPDEHIAELKAKLKATGVRAVNAYFNNAPFQDKAGAEAGVRKLFEFARKLGLRGLTGEPAPDQLDLVERMVKEYDIQLCFHNHPHNPNKPGYLNWDPKYLITLMENRDPRMGFSVDTGHLVRSGVDVIETLKLYKDRAHSVHLKDIKEARFDSEDVPYGEGISNITAILEQLKRQNFRGHVAVEYEHTTDHLLDDVKHCVRFMRSHLAPPAPLTGMMKDSPVTFPEKGALPAKWPPDVTTKHEEPEKEYSIFGTPQRSLAQIAKIQAEMPKGAFTPPKPDWTYLKRTHRILTGGGDLHVLAMGDSIVADTMRSAWLAKLAEAYPKANIRGTVYVRGGGGCQHYKEEGRIQKHVVPLKPDLMFIGGISQKDIGSIREAIHQLRAALPEVEILLATGTFGTTDPRSSQELAKDKRSGAGEYGVALEKLATEEQCAFLNMTLPWAEYIRSTKLHPHIFYRDRVHANEFGEQILSKVLMSFFQP